MKSLLYRNTRKLTSPNVFALIYAANIVCALLLPQKFRKLTENGIIQFTHMASDDECVFNSPTHMGENNISTGFLSDRKTIKKHRNI